MLNDPTAEEDDVVSPAIREQYEELMEALAESEKWRWTIGSGHTSLALLHKVARLVMRMHGPYFVTAQAVTLGLTICAAPDMDEACKRSLALRECSAADRERFIAIGKWLLQSVPFLEPMLPLFEDRPLDLHLLGAYVDHHGRQGRTADISTLKANLHKWIPTVRLTGSTNDDTQAIVISPRVKGVFSEERTEWGWNSLWSARLLVWRTHRDLFDRDPHGYSDKIRNGKPKMNQKGFPSFVYDETATSDSNNLAQGLFLGDLLKKGFRAVWTSPDSTTKEPGQSGAGRPSIAQMNGITTVTPENIAYIACLLRHILSSEANWKAQNATVFNGAAFFHKIVDAFTLEVVGQPVIEHYEFYVYGTVPGNQSSDEEEDEFAALRRQCTAHGNTETTGA